MLNARIPFPLKIEIAVEQIGQMTWTDIRPNLILVLSFNTYLYPINVTNYIT